MTPLLAPRLRSDRGFERIYRRHVRDVYRYALAMLRNPADAEDVTQTTFLNAYRAYQRGERPREPQNWLIAIAHNVCRQRFRQSERRVQEVVYDDNLAEAVVEDRDEAPTVQDIQRALGHLAFNQRSALVMRELEGRSYSEIAEMLDLSVGAVETLIFRARRTLREQLEGTLTCREAERAISRQLDGRLPHAERGSLRAHLRECKECATLARKLRAQSAAIKALGLVPLPTSLSSLASLLGQGGAAGGAGAASGVALKIAAVAAAGSVAAGVGYQAVGPLPWQSPKAAPEAARAAPAVKAAAAQVAFTANPASDRISGQAAAKRPEPRSSGPAKQASKNKKRTPSRPSVQTSNAAKGHASAAASDAAFQSQESYAAVAKASGEAKTKRESKSKGADESAPYGKDANGAQPHRPKRSDSPARGRNDNPATPRGNGPPNTPPGRATDRDQDKGKSADKSAKQPQAPLIDKGKQDLDQLDPETDHAGASEQPGSQALVGVGTTTQPNPAGQEKDKDKEKNKDKETDKEKDKGKEKGK
jgi:RNA polymerase sigma factor (sigma-70 family)